MYSNDNGFWSSQLTLKKNYFREAIGFPELYNFGIYLSEHVALPIAVAVLSRYLYDKLKDRKNTEITINNTSIEINADKIEQLILIILKEKEEK